MIELTLILLGFLIATLTSTIGLAGGTFLVPMLVLLYGLPAQNAIGVSLFSIMFMTVSATFAFAYRSRINYRVGLLLDTLDVPGAFLGAYITTLIASRWLAGAFGFLLLFIAAHLIWRRNSRAGINFSKSIPFSRRVVGYCMTGSFASGLVSGLFGIGGGVIDETVMILLLGMSMHVSAGTAMFGMAITTVAAFVPHWFFGNVLFDYAIPLAIGCVIGGQFGPYLSKRTRAVTLRRILGAAFVLIGIRMLLVPFI